MEIDDDDDDDDENENDNNPEEMFSKFPKNSFVIFLNGILQYFEEYLLLGCILIQLIISYEHFGASERQV